MGNYCCHFYCGRAADHCPETPVRMAIKLYFTGNYEYDRNLYNQPGLSVAEHVLFGGNQSVYGSGRSGIWSTGGCALVWDTFERLFVISGRIFGHSVIRYGQYRGISFILAIQLHRGVTRIVVFLCTLLLISVYTDLKSDRIPNELIVIGIIGGFLSIQSWDMFWTRLFQVLVIFLLLFPFFSVGLMGAGDIKCICMTGMYFDTGQFASAIAYSFFIAAFFSLCKWIQSYCSKERIAHFLIYLRHSFLCRNLFPYESENRNKNTTIHLALPIFLGVLTSIGGTYL